MANHTLTGTLGSGKSIIATSRARDCLLSGRKLASNMDYYLHEMLPITSRANYIRISDFPTHDEFWQLGIASNSKNEDTFGLIILDELAVFLNSRDWQGKSRDLTIKFLRHVRKQHWHTLFLTQDIDSIDKQARNALIEHKVNCKRTDRLSIPVLGPLLRLFGFSGKLPKSHWGIVHYGQNDLSPVVDTWKVFSNNLHKCYNTDQIYTDSPFFYFDCPTYYFHHRPFDTNVVTLKGTTNQTAEQTGMYTVLSPWHTHGRYLPFLERYKNAIKYFAFIVSLIFLVFYWLIHSQNIKQVVTIKKPNMVSECEPVTNFIRTEQGAVFTSKDGSLLETKYLELFDNNIKLKVNQKCYVHSL